MIAVKNLFIYRGPIPDPQVQHQFQGRGGGRVGT